MTRGNTLPNLVHTALQVFIRIGAEYVNDLMFLQFFCCHHFLVCSDACITNWSGVDCVYLFIGRQTCVRWRWILAVLERQCSSGPKSLSSASLCSLGQIPSLFYRMRVVGAPAHWLLRGFSEYGKCFELCWHMETCSH